MIAVLDKIINDVKNHNENLEPGFRDSLARYCHFFVQRSPHYAIKSIGGEDWRIKHKPLSDPPILGNLYGKYSTGSLAQWYPNFFCIDIDDKPLNFVNSIRESLRLDESNSMLYSSESPDCYHIFCKPILNGKPPTINRLHLSLKSFSLRNQVEIYPHAKRIFRLPFSPYFDSYDPVYYKLDDWQEKLYWFEKLDDVDISLIPDQQLTLDLNFKEPVNIKNFMQEGKELHEHGLQCSSSRNESEFKVIYYLWRNNITQAQAVFITWKWIKEKHNGFSKDIIRNPKQVKKEIERQSALIYEKFELSNILPDTTNNLFHGYLTRPDIPEIFKYAQGNIPRAKFFTYLLKYSYPRRHRDFIGIHRDKLINWSSYHTYLKYLDELESKGLIKRGSAYAQGNFSKDLKINWNYGSEYNAILDDGRSVDTLDDIIRFTYNPRDFRQLLNSSGCKRTTAIMIVKKVFSHVSKNATHI